MSKSQPRARQRGVTLAELLVVVAIIALAVTVSIPMINRTVGSARVRAAANQFAVTIRAVRMIAVSKQSSTELVVSAMPANFYEYTDAEGRKRTFTMPSGVQISSFQLPEGTESSDPIKFQPNGALAGGVTTMTRFEADIAAGTTEVWEVRTNSLGVSSAARIGAP
ncbi:MAG: prepilin-type N-terminal cleavage/methylation domain-containing protein [bacterium]|nr:prepilin-type N-terminal cleavage/methylation domain-containing protein [bacterium]